jgi:hypothetical protein
VDEKVKALLDQLDASASSVRAYVYSMRVRDDDGQGAMAMNEAAALVANLQALRERLSE